MTETETIQAQLIAARRHQILDAAMKVFAEKGFHRATTKDIARTAGIAEGTIYNYFDNKMELLVGILTRLRETTLTPVGDVDLETWMRAAVSRHQESVQNGSDEFFRATFPEVLVNKELADLYLQQIIRPTYALIEERFQQWVEQGLIKPIDLVLTVRVISAMFAGLQMMRLIGEPELLERWDQLPDVITDLILNGLKQGSPQP